MVDERARVELAGWIVSAAVAGASDVDILVGLCERLNREGFSLVRASVAQDLLDPTWDACAVRWLRHQGGVEETFERLDKAVVNENWLGSPFAYLVERGDDFMQRPLDASYRRGEFAMLDRLQDEGATEYVAFTSRVGTSLRMGESEGIVSSWTTDAAGGFAQAQIDLIAAVMPVLTLAFMLRMAHRNARTLIATYLGSSAADRVLAGNVVRGRASPIQAVVWYSDLVGFTRITDTASADTVLALLNDYAEAQVEEIEAHGGHVLKFIGDGLLAVPQDDMAEACRHALEAAASQRQRIAALNRRRGDSGLPVTDTHVALHVGELLYGNVGSRRRLDFTVLGSAVNEAARMESLCGSLEQNVIVSSAFAQAAGEEARRLLVSLGRYAMKGVARPQELFTLDMTTGIP